MPPTSPLGSLSFSIGNCDHILTHRNFLLAVLVAYSGVAGSIKGWSGILQRGGVPVDGLIVHHDADAGALEERPAIEHRRRALVPPQAKRIVDGEQPRAVGLFASYFHALAIQFHWAVRSSARETPIGSAQS